MENEEKPFDVALASIFEADEVSIPLLYRLSDMNEAQMNAWRQRWQQADDGRRQVIARHLVDICEENFVVDFAPLFMELFADPLPAVRVAALDGLWDNSDVRLIPRIIQLMEADPDAQVKAAAAAALAHYVLMAEWGQISRGVLPRLVDALLNQYDRAELPLVARRAALEALGGADHPRVAGLIAAAYASDEPELRLSAVFAMGSSVDEQWLPTVLSEMNSPLPAMRVEAVRAAGAIGHADALPALARLAADDDLEVGLAVVEALAKIGGDTATRMLQMMAEDNDFRRLHEAVDEALEEMDWLSGDLDLLDMWPEPETDEDDVDAYFIDDDNGSRPH